MAPQVLVGSTWRTPVGCAEDAVVWVTGIDMQRVDFHYVSGSRVGTDESAIKEVFWERFELLAPPPEPVLEEL